MSTTLMLIISSPHHVAMTGTELDRLVLHKVAHVHDAFLDERPRTVAAILGQPGRPMDGRSEIAALGAELALAAPPQMANDLLRALDLLLRLLLVECRQC